MNIKVEYWEVYYGFSVIWLMLLFIILISITINMIVTINERKSETGQDINTPLRPKNIGNIRIAGRRKITCREKLMIRAGTTFPIAWKSDPPTI